MGTIHENSPSLQFLFWLPAVFYKGVKLQIAVLAQIW
jgi:hypothetical protein